MAKRATEKRKLPSSGLERRVRARKEVEPEPHSDESIGGLEEEGEDSPSDQDVEDMTDEADDRSGDEDEGDDGSEPEEARPSSSKPKMDLSSISFGALAKAQASMPSARRKKASSSRKHPDSASESDANSDPGPDSANNHHRSFASSKGTKPGSKPAKRSSKHAPTEMTSKRPVSRKRDFSETLSSSHARAQPRDPRFDPAVAHGPGTSFDEAKARKAYAFLDEYRDSEMAALRTQAKKTKDADAKERLKRELASMMDKKKATQKRDRERAVIEDHRLKEKDLVRQGKQPFYLKKSEQKKRLLTEQFKGMKKRQVDKVIERRRKKVSSKEKKDLDHLQRRGAES